MKSLTSWVLLVVVIAASGGVGYWIGHHSAGGAEEEESGGSKSSKPQEKPVATVNTVPARRGTLTETVTAYGTVNAPPSEVRVISVPFEARVTRVLAAPGQVVSAGQPLVEVEGSAAAILALQEAKNAATAAERDLQLVRQRYEQKLATNQELYTAENASRTAQARLRSLQQAGGEPRQLKSEVAGLISKVDVQPGQVVAIGGPLIEIAPQNRIEVRLMAEPEDAKALKPDQGVELRPIDDPQRAPVAGKIRLIGQRVDPATRLVDVLVSLPPDAKLLLESYVTGALTRTSAEGIVVPREAVLPTDDGAWTLFTVKDGKAIKHNVKVGAKTDRLVEVTADDVKEGDSVVITGNYELDDGMQVQTGGAQ